MTRVDDRKHTYTKTTKPRAKRLWLQGCRVAVCPSRMRPGYPHRVDAEIKGGLLYRNREPSREEPRTGEIFDRFVSRFEMRNCTDADTGYTPSFWIMEAWESEKRRA